MSLVWRGGCVLAISRCQRSLPCACLDGYGKGSGFRSAEHGYDLFRMERVRVNHRVVEWLQLLKPDGWMKMMEALELVDDDFTLNNAMLCYVWSRMSTIDEVKDYSKFESLTFVDFLEALGLIADSKTLPMASDMAEAGINSLQWALAKSSGAAPPILPLTAGGGHALSSACRIGCVELRVPCSIRVLFV